MTKEKLLTLFNDIDIYPVTCKELSLGRTDEEVLKAVIEGGAKIIQLRDKHSSKRILFKKAEFFRKITKENNVLLIINDHIDIAISVDADGVHLGQDDFPLIQARELLPEKIIGISTHTPKQAIEAQNNGADYVNIGPLATTATKNLPEDSYLGFEAIDDFIPVLKIPFTVMGGINETNIDQALKHGARKIAVVTAVTKANNITQKTKELRKTINSYKAQK